MAPVLAALPHARLVGGCVRDTLAGLPVTDFDLATPDPPEQVIRALDAAGLRSIPTGLAHGTVTALSQGQNIEITTLRRDEATDGRHASVAWTDDWRVDAARRDFTINAMSLDRAGHLYDYYHGEADLGEGIVRFVGEAAQRIAEDRLRILRFFRFHARFGRVPPDAATIAAISEAAPGVGQLSAERVWSELKRILALPDPAATVALMQQTGVLDAALPEGSAPRRLARLVATGAPADPLLRLAALLTGDAQQAADRLKFSALERDQLAALQSGPTPAPGDDHSTRRRLLATEPAATLIARTWLAGSGLDWDGLRAWLAAAPIPVFPLEGRDALALGMAPGPLVGEALRAVRAWWLQGGCVADKAACREQLRAYFAS